MWRQGIAGHCSCSVRLHWNIWHWTLRGTQLANQELPAAYTLLIGSTHEHLHDYKHRCNTVCAGMVESDFRSARPWTALRTGRGGKQKQEEIIVQITKLQTISDWQLGQRWKKKIPRRSHSATFVLAAVATTTPQPHQCITHGKRWLKKMDSR